MENWAIYMIIGIFFWPFFIVGLILLISKSTSQTNNKSEPDYVVFDRTKDNQNQESGQNNSEQKIYRTAPKRSAEFNSTVKTGLTIQIVTASLTIFGTLIAILVLSIISSVLRFSERLTYTEIQTTRIIMHIVITVLSIVVLPGSIVCLILSSLALKNQTSGLVTAAGVLGLFYGLFFGGLMTLSGQYQNQQNNNQN